MLGARCLMPEGIASVVAPCEPLLPRIVFGVNRLGGVYMVNVVISLLGIVC